MDLSNIMNRKCEWLDIKGPKSSIALSSRVRLARNLRGHIYFNRANDTQREETLNTLLLGFKHSASFKSAGTFMMSELSELDKTVLVERHLMSREHMLEDSHKALIVEDEQIISAMINEEDHLRLQVIRSGFNLRGAWNIADSMDDELSRNVGFDYSNRFGYLTACPTNTGTGLRASVMLHLSALVMTGEIDGVYEAISKLGLAMRGFYGEGTEALGDFFQISNQVALGHSELEAINYLEGVINRIVTREESLRQELLGKRQELLADRVFRSYGTLKSARIITFAETIKLLSSVRLGVALGMIDDIGMSKVNRILLRTQPAHLQKEIEEGTEKYERDIKRADLLKDELGTGN